jgi:tetratricopeptide (TPR) repeat protein
VENQLTNILHHHSGTSTEEADLLYTLANQYPYSQVLQALTARASQDHDHAEKKIRLQRAAVYATDRSALKHLMSEPVNYVTPKSEEAKAVKQEKKQMAVKEIEKQSTAKVESTETDYADEVIHDLERLQELKHNFEAYFDGSIPEPKPSKQEEQVKQEIIQDNQETKEAEAKPAIAKKKLSKKERIVQLAKELNKVPPSPEEPAWAEKPIKKSKEKNTELEPLVNEIKTTRKKVQPESEKTREQIEIIEQFIKSNPLITPPKSKPSENQDLASTLKSGEFGDHIVSETLAEILIRQGKKDKAIEVYKKLIWKFPQKKAYFAAQIEELRK